MALPLNTKIYYYIPELLFHIWYIIEKITKYEKYVKTKIANSENTPKSADKRGK